jgi:hypothetical protein
MAKEKTCPSCGVVFECLHSVDCWCAGYVIPEETMKQIRAQYSDCLCADCLGKYASETGKAKT